MDVLKETMKIFVWVTDDLPNTTSQKLHELCEDSNKGQLKEHSIR